MLNKIKYALAVALATVAFAAMAQEHGKKYQESGEIVQRGKSSTTYEKGVVEGVFYRVYANRSGNFAGNEDVDADDIINYEVDDDETWLVDCDVNEDAGGKYCTIVRLPLVVNLNEQWVYVAVVPDDIDKKKEMLVQIDKHEANSTEDYFAFLPPKGTVVIEQMLAGKEIKISYHQLPDGKPVEKTFPLYGFKQAFDYIKWAYKNHPADSQK